MIFYFIFWQKVHELSARKLHWFLRLSSEPSVPLQKILLAFRQNEVKTVFISLLKWKKFVDYNQTVIKRYSWRIKCAPFDSTPAMKYLDVRRPSKRRRTLLDSSCAETISFKMHFTHIWLIFLRVSKSSIELVKFGSELCLFLGGFFWWFVQVIRSEEQIPWLNEV